MPQPDDSLVAAVQSLKRQITPEKTADEIEVEYAILLGRYPTERQRLLHLVRSEPTLYDAIDQSRQKSLNNNGKLRANFKSIKKRAGIDWPDLDIAFGHYDWTRTTFSVYLRQLIMEGASFGTARGLITTARQNLRDQAFEPKHVQQALQHYRATKRVSRESERQGEEPPSEAEDEPNLEQEAGQGARSPKRRRLDLSSLASSDASNPPHNEVELSRAHPLSTQYNFQHEDQAPEVEVAPSSPIDRSDPAPTFDFLRPDLHTIALDTEFAMSSSAAATAPSITPESVEGLVQQLNDLRAHVCDTYTRHNNAAKALDDMRAEAVEAEKECRRLLWQGEDASFQKERARSAKNNIDSRAREETAERKKYDEAQALWMRVYEMVIWPIDKGAEVPGAGAGQACS
jgi:hypothetical protein